MTRGAKVAWIYGLLAVLAVPVYAHFVSPNELSRWLLAAALVEEGTPEVTRLAPLLGAGFEDLAVVNGRSYSNKAPGGALAALPGYLLARPFAGPPGPASIRPVLWAMRLFGATTPLLVLAWLLDRAARRLGGESEGRAFALFALLFGTPLFAHGLLLFAHALVACALFGAFSSLFLSGPGKEKRDDLLAGAWIGLAVSADYTAAVPGLVLLAAACARDPWRLCRIAAGGAPFALLVAAYNGVCFGSPFSPSYEFEKHDAYRQIASSGFFGVRVPTLLGFLKLLLDPTKGLLLLSPILILAPRALSLLRQPLRGAPFFALVLVPVSTLLLFSGYPNFGGWTLGPRYVLGALPFLVLPLAFVRVGPLAAALLGGSAAAVVGTTIPFPFVPDGFPFPWASFAFPLLAHGNGLPSVFPPSAWPAIAVPFVLAATAAFLAVPRRCAAAFALGAIGWWGAGFLPPSVRRPAAFLQVQVAYVEDVYLERTGVLDRLFASFPPGVSRPERLLARRERERALPPTERRR